MKVEVRNFEGMGGLLLALWIAKCLSQRKLAERLEAHESQVKCDKRGDYYGASVVTLDPVTAAPA